MTLYSGKGRFARLFSSTLLILFLLLSFPLLGSAVRAETAGNSFARDVDYRDTYSTLHIRNVDFRYDEETALRIKTLSGTMRSRYETYPINADNRRSFDISVDSAVIGLKARDLSGLFNNNVFADGDAPLSSLEVEYSGDTMVLGGILYKVVPMPFSISMALEFTDTGVLHLHPTNMSLSGIPGKGLMRALDIKLEDLLDLEGYEGIWVRNNEMYLEPLEILPPPYVHGNVEDVRLDSESDELKVVFTDDSAGTDSAKLHSIDKTNTRIEGRNYILIRGGYLKFGRLFMENVHLNILDLTGEDPLNFYLDEYTRQLEAGRIKAKEEAGLDVYMVDYDKL